ncbi:MAG: HemK family protein methyltransferase [bacterium]
MQLIQLFSYLKQKYLLKSNNKTYNLKALIQIIELVLEKKLYQIKYSQEINPNQIKQINKLCKLVFYHMFPIQYLITPTQFLNLDLHINPHTLIPRPETELIVQKIIEKLKSILHDNQKVIIIDLGIGSGNILLSIIKNLPPQISPLAIGIDISFNALEVCYKNLQINNINNVTLINSSLLNIIKSDLNFKTVIISNPPYLTKKEIKPELFFEPPHALITPTKNYYYKQIIDFCLKQKECICMLEIDQKSLQKLKPLLHRIQNYEYQHITRKIYMLTIFNFRTYTQS